VIITVYIEMYTAHKMKGKVLQMRVCLVCEGSYPFVMGGVSSWIQMILTSFPDIEFVIWTIATNEEEMSEYKYQLPKNVVEVRKIYLTNEKFVVSNKRVKLSKSDKLSLRSLILDDSNKANWNEILNFFKIHKHDLVEILMSREFFEIAVELYNRSYNRTVFSDFLWNLRSMYFPLVSIFSAEMLPANLYHSVSTGYAGVLGAVASEVFQVPFLLTEHGIYTREREEEIIKSDWVQGAFKEIWIEFFNKLSHIAYNSANEVISLFETNKTLQIELGCPEEKIRIIPNGIDIEKFERLPQKTSSSNQFFNIGVVARIVPIKDIKTMLFAFDLVTTKIPNARLVICGPNDEDMEYYNECVSLINELEIKGVLFEGRVDVSKYLSDFDIMLLTSISEGQPLAVLEGMAARIPQVATNVGSCQELLYGKNDDFLGQAGLIVPIMNIQSIADAIVELAEDINLRLQMGNVGYNRVKKYYQKSTFLDAYYELYKKYGEGEKIGRNRL